MNRRKFLKHAAAGASAAAFAPYLNLMAGPSAGKVKITDVQCILTRIGFRVSPLVKISTNVGLVGIGECHHDEKGHGAKDIVLNVCKPILMGQDPMNLEYLVFKMSTRTSYYGGNHGVATHAITGVEFAMWDLIGKINGQPVHRILGGGSHVKEVRAYASTGPRDMSSKESCAEFAERMKRQGWTACKTNFLRDQRWEQLDNRRMSNVQIDRNAKGFGNMRDALGLDFDIAVHCHWELDFDSAYRLAQA
ncbi:MAG: twin-arginine translocation signal domain-containing protein, partial [Acidobacteria bacterium]|nr:twin-arginine translocation signal domain-containing protein [Acidobacteriota bacterium]